MAAYHRVYDSLELGSAPEPYDRYPSMGYLYIYSLVVGSMWYIKLTYISF